MSPFQPLNEEQVRVLLATAMAYDNRNPGEANIAAWSEAAQRARWRFGPAQQAIHAHYAESSKFIMPGDVTQRLKVESRFPPKVGETPHLEEGPPPDPAGQERIRRIVSGLADRLRWPRRPSVEDPALSVDCPHCHASPGRPCARLATRGPHRGEYVQLSRSHPSRVELAAGREAEADERGATHP